MSVMYGSEEVTLEEIKERARLAGLEIPPERLELVRGFVSDALRPIRALDSGLLREVEPAAVFMARPEPGPDVSAHES